jgi:hypothetical protein
MGEAWRTLPPPIAELRQPGVQLGQRLRIQGVVPSRDFGSDYDHPGLPQDP